MTEIDRRTLIGATCLGCMTLAGCGSSSKTASPASSAAASTGAAPTASASASGSGGGAALATLASIPVGSAISAKSADGKAIIVARPTETTAIAFSAKCTHMGCPVAPAGAELHCPCHGSAFNATTGAVINGPAAAPLNPFPVTVANGQVMPA